MRKKLKCFLSILVVFTLMISTICISFAKEDIIVGEMYDGEFRCELNKSAQTLTIEGLGMLIFGDVEAALGFEMNLPTIKQIIIKEGVYLINIESGYYGYHDFSDVTTITIPSTMKRVNWKSFSKIEKLETINYGGSKEEWEKIIFDGGNDVLNNAKINFNAEVPATEGAEKYECDMINEQTLSSGVHLSLNYYTGVFSISGKGLVGSASCGGGGEAPITLYFGELTKDYCYRPAIQHVVFESGITEIGASVLYGRCIESITIPETVVKIYPSVISGSSNIKDIYYEGTKADWIDLDIGADNEELILAEKHFEVQTSAKKLTVELYQKNYVYDGEIKFPRIVVLTENGNQLSNNIDYYIDAEHNYMGSCSMSAKTPGKYKIVVKLCDEYSGQVTKYFYIRAKAPEITDIDSRKDGFTVTWNKYNEKENGKVNGYEVQYSTSPKFKNAKTIKMNHAENYAKRVDDLNTGTTYYVRVRALTKVSDGYIRSAWSDVSKVRAR